MGSPQQPSAEQRRALERASELSQLEEPKSAEVREGQVTLRFALPRQAVSLVRLEW